MQREISQKSQLLDKRGLIATPGYGKSPIWDYNPERLSRFRRLLRLKEWDYYGVFIDNHFVSVTVSHIGYAGLLFAYWIDFEAGRMKEQTRIIPLGKGCTLPHSADSGDVHAQNGDITIDFVLKKQARHIVTHWPEFEGKETLKIDLTLHQPSTHTGITMATPIPPRGFYYNQKIPAMRAEGYVTLGAKTLKTDEQSFGVLDWGRGVWNYRTFWNWASASGQLEDGRSLGLNLGMGFGDLSAATENSLFLDGVLHKLDNVEFHYTAGDWLSPWRFTDNDGRLDVTMTPVFDRPAYSNLLIIASEVHQVFGRYNGFVIADDGERIDLDGINGWAEDHRARW